MGVGRAALGMFPLCDPPYQVASVLRMFSYLTHKTSPHSQVSIPRPNAWTASFPARLDSGKEGSRSIDPIHNREGVSGSGGSGRGGGFAATGGGCSNPATDGVYVYVWDPASKRVHKASMVTFLSHKCTGRSHACSVCITWISVVRRCVTCVTCVTCVVVVAVVLVLVEIKVGTRKSAMLVLFLFCRGLVWYRFLHGSTRKHLDTKAERSASTQHMSVMSTRVRCVSRVWAY